MFFGLSLQTSAAEEKVIKDFNLTLGQQIIQNGPPVTPIELKSLDPLCKLVTANMASNNFFWLNLTPHAIFDKPEYRMGKNAYWLHHHCIAQLARIRFFASSNNLDQARNMEVWQTNAAFDVHAISAATSTYGYKYVIYTDLAESYYFDKQYHKAIDTSRKAIEINNKYPKAYRILAESFMKSGQTNMALEAVKAGLNIIPDSKTLKNLHEELTAKSAPQNNAPVLDKTK